MISSILQLTICYCLSPFLITNYVIDMNNLAKFFVFQI